MIFRDMPIRRKLMTVLLLTSGVVLLLTCLGFITYEIITLRKDMVDNYVTRAKIIAANSTASLAFQNETDATDVLGGLKADQRVVVACIYDDKGNIFARYPVNAPTDAFPARLGGSGYRRGHLDTFCPVIQGDRILGAVYLQSDLSSLTDRYYVYVLLVAAIITGSFLVAFLLSRLLQKQISLPILALAETAQAVSKHRDFSVRAKKFGEDESGLLTDAFNRMLAEIQEQDQALKASRADLTEKNVFLNSVMENMSEGLVVADTNEKMLVFNRSAERITGMGVSQETSGTWSREYGVFQEDGVTPYPSGENPLVLALQGGNPNNVVQFLRNSKIPNGVYVSVNGRPIRDEFGQIKAGMVVVRDITEQRRAEEFLKSYTKKLEESNRDLQDFVFVASHDLQEPLRKIQSFSNFLKEESGPLLPPASVGYLSRVQDAARRMSILIEDLLQLTRVTTKAKPFEPVDLSEIIKEVLADLEIRLRESGGKIEVGKLPKLEADASQMRQLFQNLISNSLKYHKSDAPPLVKVEGETDAQGKKCRIRVKDNGIGFEPRHSEKIFNIFQRLHGSEEYEGTGIGLAICRKVVERHGGTITATSQLGEGATFEVVLPLRQFK